MSDRVEHDFGGSWTELKLEAISAYSKFFTGAIGSRFDTWYIDPFAGTGHRTSREAAGGVHEGTSVEIVKKQLPGSALRALELEPRFDHLRFGDAKLSHARALQELVTQYVRENGDRDVKVIRDDANSWLQDGFSSPFWTEPDRWGRKNPRALVFLDPYGMEVKWGTLKALADCGKADVWFLANLKAAVQQLSHKHSKLDDLKRRSLGEYFGTASWEEKFYEKPKQVDLLSTLESGQERSVTKAQIAEFHKHCLKGLFAYVSEPLPLRVKSQGDYFLLYCLSNSPSVKARALIAKGAEWVINRYR